MTRAEQSALKTYPVHSVLVRPARQGGYYADNHLRSGFIKGYEQAEKDLALTIEAARALVESVEKYIRQEELRSQLLIKKENLKKLL